MDIVRLHANENYFGCSPHVLQALKSLQPDFHFYPSVPVLLRNLLARKHEVLENQIVIGAGSVRLIDGIIQTFAQPGDEVLMFDRSFVAYQELTESRHCKAVMAPQTEFICRLENLLPYISERTKIIFLANPNNPTGTIISHTELEIFLEKIPREIMVITDEAYYEYVSSIHFPDSLSLQKKFSNLIILHTFSKIYGLAGLRIGYAIADVDRAAMMMKGRIPFFLNTIGEPAAIAALEDEVYIKKCAEINHIERHYLFQGLLSCGLQAVPSEANFIYVWMEDEKYKNRVCESLMKENILICNMTVFQQDKSVRIGVGDRMVNDRILNILHDL